MSTEKRIEFIYKGEKQYWLGHLESLLKEMPEAEIITIKDIA